MLLLVICTAKMVEVVAALLDASLWWIESPHDYLELIVSPVVLARFIQHHLSMDPVIDEHGPLISLIGS